jgi:demethylmenaquinone methyltransferase/2-methoxy-6-polyprenyl-1,4-benzoquinol methylase
MSRPDDRAAPAPDYDPSFVARLFDEMSGTYGLVNVLSSFGFCVLWRRQCLDRVAFRPGMVVYDLMSGMGELWPGVFRRMSGPGTVRAVDISEQMCRRAAANKHYGRGSAVEICRADVLASDLPAGSADAVVSSFGLKTFSPPQQRQLAATVARLLRPGGAFSFIEISVPPARWLRALYLFYLDRLIPPIGRALLGNPDNYRLLGVYTRAYGNSSTFAAALRDDGLEVDERPHFFGCATGVSGRRPG